MRPDLLSSPAMLLPSQIVNDPARAISERLRVERVAIHLVRLPFKEPFETSFGRIDSRLSLRLGFEIDLGYTKSHTQTLERIGRSGVRQ